MNQNAGAQKSVMVVGAGFAGVRAALDLAETGVKVYLVDKEQMPGGMLSGLEKMFPTDDCAACTALPGDMATGCQRQYPDVLNHPNIEFIGGAHLEGVEGTTGNFNVNLRLSPAFINQEQCIGCGDCTSVCPVELDPVSGKKAIASLFPQASSYLKLERGTPSPCSEICPLGVNVPAFVHLVRQKRFLEAWRIMYKVNPFPGLCGYWCHQPCRSVCSGNGGKPIDMPGLTRFVADYVYRHHYADLPIPKVSTDKKAKVAIIGSGPTGLAAARELLMSGYDVTVLESSSNAGGTLRTKVPPALGEIMDKEIALLQRCGVEILTGVSLGSDLPVENLLYCGYQAVLLAAVARVTSVSSMWYKVSNGDEVLSSYQVTLYEQDFYKHETELNFTTEEPAILQTDLPGVFAVRSLNPGIVPVDLAISAGIRSAKNIDAYLTIKSSSVKPTRVQCPIIPTPQTSERTGLESMKNGFTGKDYEVLYSPEEAVEEAKRCSTCGGGCTECGLCLEVCPSGAIDLNATGKLLNVNTNAILLTVGSESFDPSSLVFYGYGRFPNVLTGQEFEKLVSAATGKGVSLTRPSDSSSPHKIAWIQCIGSRNKELDKNYCSSICCQYALKEAVMACTTGNPKPEVVVFGMDIRPFNQDGEEYWRRAVEDYNVRFERTRVYELVETGDNDLKIRYCREDGSIIEEIFSMVVLSVGLAPSNNASCLQQIMGIKSDIYGFCQGYELNPGFTNKPGIMAAGTFCGPKDIASAVTEARAAALGILETIGVKASDITINNASQDYFEEAERVGVFVCNCAGKLSKAIDTSKIVANAKKLNRVVFAREIERACLTQGLKEITRDIKRYKINRVVLAGCSPRLHAGSFRKALVGAGIHKNLIEHVNIREQVAWVHDDQYEQATEKGMALIRAGVTKVRSSMVSSLVNSTINRAVLVVGGGPSGLTSALALANRGMQVYLVDHQWHLEGTSTRPAYTLEGTPLKNHTSEIAVKCIEHSRIKIFNASKVSYVSGGPGNFQTKISTPSGEMTVNHGAAIIAAGADSVEPGSFLYGQHPKVKTQWEFEKILLADHDKPDTLKDINTVVMVQCVGSRDPEHPYCSRTCCAEALKNALKLKEIKPKARIYVLYRDIRVFGTQEVYYQEARRQGIIFIRYEPEKEPQLTDNNGKASIMVTDHVLQQPLEIKTDLVVLSTGIKPLPENREVAQLFGLDLDQNGFFKERQAKMRPVDASIPGIFLCGPALGPTYPSEEFTQARAAVMGCLAFLARAEIPVAPHISTVKTKWCSGCGLCVTACPAGARKIHPYLHVAQVDSAICMGCGTCQAACPSGVAGQFNLTKKQILDVIDELMI